MRAWGVSLRRSDVVEIVHATGLALDPLNNPGRTCVCAEFRKLDGASTPGHAEGRFIVTVNHTRSGSVATGMKITAANPVHFKQVPLKLNLKRCLVRWLRI